MCTSYRSIDESLHEYGRGIAGGLLFSLPLLYTMEVWWAGFIIPPLRMLGGVLITFVLLLAYNRYAGLHPDASFAEVAIDSVEELGIGLLLSAFILWLLGRISGDMQSNEVLSKIIIEAMTVAIGVSVGTAQLGAANGSENNKSDDSRNGSGSHEDDAKSESGGMKDERSSNKPHFFGQVVIAFCGAFLIAANVGPTEEIVMLAVESPIYKLIGLALFSLLLAALILNFSGFRGSKRFVIGNGSTRDILRGTAVTYAVALITSAAICWFFGRFEGASLEICIGQTVVLGFPATLGASAGRLLLQSDE